MAPSVKPSHHQFTALIEEYKQRLKSDPSIQLKVVCTEMGVEYRRVIDWTTSHGIFVRKLQAEARGEIPTDTPQTFVQFGPSRHSLSCDLRGISITFPDGVNLTLQESSVESVISLLTVYQSRQGGAASCSD